METDRLIFRGRTRERFTEILKQSPKEQLRFLGLDEISELEPRLKSIERRFLNQGIGYEVFDLIEKTTKKVIGSCGFHTWIKEHSRAEIGYKLHEKYRAQGFMTEAMEKILHHGFSNMNLNRVEAMISPDNLKSIAVVERFGFVKEGVMKQHYLQNGHFSDSAIYALLSKQYKPKHITI